MVHVVPVTTAPSDVRIHSSCSELSVVSLDLVIANETARSPRRRGILAAWSIAIRRDYPSGSLSLTIIKHSYFLAKIAFFNILDEYFPIITLGDICLRYTVDDVALL